MRATVVLLGITGLLVLCSCCHAQPPSGDLPTAAPVPLSCASLKKDNVTCPKVTITSTAPIIQTSYGWAVSSVPGIAAFAQSPLEQRLANFTAVVTKKKTDTQNIVEGSLMIQNTEPVPMLLTDLIITGSPKPALDSLLPQLNFSAQLTHGQPGGLDLAGPLQFAGNLIAGLAGNILSGINATLDNVLSGDAKTILDPSSGLLAQLGLPSDDLKSQVSTFNCTDTDNAFSMEIPAFDDATGPGILQCTFRLSLKQNVRTLVTAAALVDVPPVGLVKVVSGSAFADFAAATQQTTAGAADLALALAGRQLKKGAVSAAAQDATKGARLVNRDGSYPLQYPTRLTDVTSLSVPFALQLGTYCSAANCTTDCSFADTTWQYVVTATITPDDIPRPAPASSYTTVKLGSCALPPSPSPPPAPTPAPTPAPPASLSLAPLSNILDKMALVAQQKTAQSKAELHLLKSAKADANAAAAAAATAAARQRVPASRVANTRRAATRSQAAH